MRRFHWGVISLVDIKFLRFLFFGAINTIIGLSIYLAILEITSSVTFAIVAANLVGPVFNFWSTGRFVFRNRGLDAFFPFLGGYVFLCVLNILSVDILLKAGIGAGLAQVLCLPVIVMSSYLINDRLVFRRGA